MEDPELDDNYGVGDGYYDDDDDPPYLPPPSSDVSGGGAAATLTATESMNLFSGMRGPAAARAARTAAGQQQMLLESNPGSGENNNTPAAAAAAAVTYVHLGNEKEQAVRKAAQPVYAVDPKAAGGAGAAASPTIITAAKAVAFEDDPDVPRRIEVKSPFANRGLLGRSLPAARKSKPIIFQELGHDHHDFGPYESMEEPMSPMGRMKRQNMSMTLTPSRLAGSGDNAANTFLSPIFERDLKKMNAALNAFKAELAVAGDDDSFASNQLKLIADDLMLEPQIGRLGAGYFKSTTESLGKLLDTGGEATLICKLLFIIAKPARLAECLEIDRHQTMKLKEMVDPDGLGQANSEQNLPRYIKRKLEGFFGSTAQAQLIATSPDKAALSPAKGARSAAAASGSGSGRSSSDSGTAAADGPRFRLRSQEGMVERPPLFLLNHANSETTKIKKEDFSFEKLISSGNFGSVYAATHKATGEVVAIKTMPMNMIVHKNMIGQVIAERNILSIATSNPFVVTFYCSFKTSRSLFMVMEFVKGGDVATLLENVGYVDEATARQYIAETLLALEYIHDYGVTHRDLKPANLMITSSGHIKLTDFGLSQTGLMASTMLTAQDISQGAKVVWQGGEGGSGAVSERALTGSGDLPLLQLAAEEGYGYSSADKRSTGSPGSPGSGSLSAAPSVVGTPGYMAPEAILGLPVGPAVDFWAVGIILYELLTGVLPFRGNTAEVVFDNTVNSKLEFPEEAAEATISDTATDLIRHLLMKRPFARLGSQPTSRLGSMQGGDAGDAGRGAVGAAQVKRHAFFCQRQSSGGPDEDRRMAPVDWTKLLHQKVLFVPELSSELDTSYFDTRTDRYQVRQHSEQDPILSPKPEEQEAPRLRSFSHTANFEPEQDVK